jgi:hypothetical protein
MVQKLASIPEGDGTLLDTTTVMLTAGIGEGAQHNPYNMNVLLAGGGIPALGERRVFPTGTPMANLYVSLLHKFGVQQDVFGDDSTGSLLTL